MFSNIAKNLKIPDHSRSFIRALEKTLTCRQTTDYSEKQTSSEFFGNEKNKSCSKNRFSFSFIEKKNEIRKEIVLLEVNEISQCTKIPTKITKENFDLVSDFI